MYKQVCAHCGAIWDDVNMEKCLICNTQFNTKEQTTEGKKYDQDKLRWDLLPIEIIEEVVQILTFGAKKYGANNWQQVESDRYYAALMRHLVQWRKGEQNDSESGMSHIAHALCNLVFLRWKELNQ